MQDNADFRRMELLCPLNLPPYPFKITEQNGQYFLFDDIRKKTILITPEEWVRQHFIQYLVAQKQYPKTLIQLEGGLKLHGLAKRTDILVYNSSAEKILLVECKAPTIKITQKVFDQIARYNMVHNVPILAVTNGLQHFFCKIDFTEKKYFFMDNLPDYEYLK
ncbi:MAG: type I restriction enzyme HsdR N-terminal domain-containing protein [Janthinobacterium lividum]